MLSVNRVAIYFVVTILLCACVTFATIEVSIDSSDNDFNGSSNKIFNVFHQMKIKPVDARDTYRIVNDYWEDRGGKLSLRFYFINDPSSFIGRIDYFEEENRYLLLLDEMDETGSFSKNGEIIARKFIGELEKEFGEKSVVVTN